MLITSLENKKVKYICSLQDPKIRKKEHKYIIEGEHLIKEAIKNNVLDYSLILEGEYFDIESDYVTENVMKKLTNMKSLPRIIGVCNMKENNHIGNHILMLDRLQDPGNLGTIIRSAKAFNIDTIIMSNDSVDMYNDKVIRSTQGMFMNMNIIKTDLIEEIKKLKELNYKILGTSVTNGKDVKDVKYDKFVLIMGSEGTGISDEINEICDEFLYIKMNSECESLNVAVATSILLYELNRGNNE